MEVLLIVWSSFFESLTLEESLILVERERHRLVEAFLLQGILPLEKFLLSRDSCRESSSRLEFACSYETALVVEIFPVIDSSFVENAVLAEVIFMVEVFYHISSMNRILKYEHCPIMGGAFLISTLNYGS